MITDQPVNNHDDLRNVADNILREVGLSIGDSGGKVTFAGAEPVRKTTMKAGAAPAIILAANAVAEAAIWRERTGVEQDIHIDLRKAWIEQSPWQLDAGPVHDHQRRLEDVQLWRLRRLEPAVSDSGRAFHDHVPALPVAGEKDPQAAELRA